MYGVRLAVELKGRVVRENRIVAHSACNKKRVNVAVLRKSAKWHGGVKTSSYAQHSAGFCVVRQQSFRRPTPRAPRVSEGGKLRNAKDWVCRKEMRSGRTIIDFHKQNP